MYGAGDGQGFGQNEGFVLSAGILQEGYHEEGAFRS